VIGLPRSRCRRHQAALFYFVDRGERAPGLDAAFDHVGRCTVCRRYLEGTALTIAALRRLGRAIAAEEPPTDAWPRLRDRLSPRPRQPWPAHLHVGGLVLSAWIVAIVVGPSLIATNRTEPWTIPATAGGGSALGHRDDARVRAVSDPLELVASVPWVVPDGSTSIPVAGDPAGQASALVRGLIRR